MSKQEVADYVCGGNLSTLSDWIRRGIMPGPIPGTKRWDRKAVDAALDRLSGLQTTIAPVAASPYDQWKATQDAGQA
jgi:hypothetical protein